MWTLILSPSSSMIVTVPVDSGIIEPGDGIKRRSNVSFPSKAIVSSIMVMFAQRVSPWLLAGNDRLKLSAS